MTLLFTICAVIGTTVLLLQTFMQLFGLASDFTTADVDTSLGGIADPTLAGHGSSPVGHDGSLGPTHTHPPLTADADITISDPGLNSNERALPDPADLDVLRSHFPSKLVEFISVQTVVAFLAFFGLAGLASQQAGISMAGSIVIALGAGAFSMVLLTRVFRLYRTLERDGTVRIQRALEKTGRVYLRIPANRSGTGKITLKLQGRLVELKARSAGPLLPTGSEIVVTKILDDATVEVISAADVSDVAAVAESSMHR